MTLIEFRSYYFSHGIACHILIQYAQLEQTETFPDLWSLITEDGECTTEFCTRFRRGRRSGHHCRKYGKSRSIPISTKM